MIESVGDIQVNDLHSFASGRLEQIQKPADVHFTGNGSRILGFQVARSIEQRLPQPAQEILTATGRVFHDKNENRILDDGEQGQSGVRVSNGRDIVITDDDGRYSLEVDGDTILFVIKPSGWRTPLDENNQPQFFYIHKPQGSPVSCFPGVAPTGPLPGRIDFPLYPQNEPQQFKALLFGDPQPRNQRELDYIAHDVVEELIGTDASFGVTLGDIMFDDLNLFQPSSQLVGLIGIPWYNVIGNHDINADASEDHYSDETFERAFDLKLDEFATSREAFCADHGRISAYTSARRTRRLTARQRQRTEC